MTEHTAENDAPCRLGRIEYDGAQYCHEHGGFLEPGVQSRRCRLAPPVAGLGAPARVIPPGSRDQA